MVDRFPRTDGGRRDRCPTGTRLVGVFVSDPAKVGQDADTAAGMDRDLGVAAWLTRDALLALQPDAIVYTAETETCFMDGIGDFTQFRRAGINVVASGPVLLQFPHGIIPDEMITSLAGAGREAGRRSTSTASIGLRQRCPAAGADQPVTEHRPHPGR